MTSDTMPRRATRPRRRRVAVTIMATLALLAGGCTSPPAESSLPTGRSTAVPSTAQTATGPVPVETASPPRSEGWVESISWRPSAPVRDLRELTEEEKIAFRDADLAELARTFRLEEPPDVELERWIRHDEADRFWSECYSEAGIESIVDPTRNGFPSVTARNRGPEDEELLRRTHWTPIYICHARFSIDPVYQQPPTRDQARVAHEYQTEFWVPCVRAAGFDVLDPPDRETAIDLILAGDYWPIWPHGEPPEDDYRINDACGNGMAAAAYLGY